MKRERKPIDFYWQRETRGWYFVQKLSAQFVKLFHCFAVPHDFARWANSETPGSNIPTFLLLLPCSNGQATQHEFAGALYHVTSRGDHQEDIFLSGDDRKEWLEVLGTVCSRFNWVVHACCQMTNHHHLLLETVDGNLSSGLRPFP